MEKQIFSVTQYGATGRGKTNDTVSIQQAINEASQAGGGTVFFPPGNYLTGTLFLKSQVTLYLEAGATLWGSKKKEDYQRTATKGPDLGDGYLLYGKDLENVTIEGRGTIDGQGQAFWTRQMLSPVVLKPKEYRPRALMYVVGSRNILIRDVTLRNSPCYTVWLLGCDGVNIRGLTLINPRKGPNTDGLDIDCCRNVRISDCHIECGDDCIALKSDARRLGYQQACENITVTNCTLSSTACGIRVGYEGDAPIRNCVFNNLVMVNTDIGIDIVSVLPANASNIKVGAEIERIIFSDIVMEDVNQAIFVWLGNQSPRKSAFKGKIENILIDNVFARAKNACYIGGYPERSIRGVELNNIKLMMQGKMDAREISTPGVWGGEKLPCGLYCRYIDDLKINNFRVEWPSSDHPASFRYDQVKNLHLNGFEEK
jgi:polygalacturonase